MELHKGEQWIVEYGQKIKQKGYKVVSYADDFVVICSIRRGAEEALKDIACM